LRAWGAGLEEYSEAVEEGYAERLAGLREFFERGGGGRPRRLLRRNWRGMLR